MLDEIAPSVWIVDGPVVSFLGFPYSTRMAVVRLGDGSLWVWSPVEATDELRAAVDALGPVRHLVAPNKIHHLFLGPWREAYPEARLYAPPGLRERRRDLSFDADLGDEPEPSWGEEIEHVIFRGSRVLEEVVFFHPASRTAFVTDLVQRFDPEKLPTVARWIMRLDSLVGPEGSTPREWRLTFLRRGPTRKALRKLLDWNPARVVIAHGEWIRENGRDVLARSLRWIG